jgi:predicted site-specific integrase-resolvase
MEEKLFLTPEEVCERYMHRINTRTLANWRSAGTSPPFVKCGGRVLYPLDKLVEWEQKRTVTGTHQYGK